MKYIRNGSIGMVPDNTFVLGCKALAPELRALGVPPARMHLLDQELHRCPEQLQQTIAAHLKTLESRPKVQQVVLVYGYCGGGLDGIQSSRLELIVPRIHDCIPLLLGQSALPPNFDGGAAFYLSPGWIDYGQTPYSEYFRCQACYGREDARWIASEMLKGYREVVLVETVAGLLPHHRRYARRMARLFHLACRQITGRSTLLEMLLRGTGAGPILHLPPGTLLQRQCFF